MANFGKRPQPYRIQFPITAPQVEQIDEMFEILFKRIGQVQTELINTTGVATSAASAAMSLLSEVTMATEDDARLGAIGQTGATGPAGPVGMALMDVGGDIEPALGLSAVPCGGVIDVSYITARSIVQTLENLVTTETDGIVLTNPTAATSGVLVQMSPRVRFRGTAWNGATSDNMDAYLEWLPQSGTTRGQIKIGVQRNGASTTYPLILDANPTSGASILTLSSPGAFRGGDGTAASPVFGFVNSGGGNSIGFWTPAPNDIDLVCGGANQILWGVGLWRNGSALSMGWASSVDPNSTVADTAFIRKATAKIKFYTSETAETAGFVLDFATDTVAKFRDRADAAYATIDCLGLKASGTAGFNGTVAPPTTITVVNGIVTNVA